MAEIADLPQWITDALAHAHQEHEPRAAPDVELDTPYAIQEARAWLALQPPAADGNASDTFYRYAARLKDFGLSCDATTLLLHECNPSYTEDDIGQRVENAYRYGQNSPGSDVPLPPDVVFAGVEPPEPISVVARPFGWWIDREFPPVEWVWDQLIVADMPNLLTGLSKVGKTTFLLNLIVHAAGGLPFLNAKTERRPVVAFLAEDRYGPVRDRLAAIVGELGLGRDVLDQIHLRSTLDEPIEDAFLARVDDNGAVVGSRFMAEGLAPFLHTLERPILILDPISEFVSFNRYADMSARKMVTGFLNSVCRIGHGVTIIATDHPSGAGTRDGRDVAGSRQMEASFPIVTTLKAGDWSQGLVPQREMTFGAKFNRYAPALRPTTFYHIHGRHTFSMHGAPGQTLADRQQTVYRYVIERLDRGEFTNCYNKGGAHGPLMAAQDLAMAEDDVKEALRKLQARRWLQHAPAMGSSGNRTPAHLERGSEAPKLASLDDGRGHGGEPW